MFNKKLVLGIMSVISLNNFIAFVKFSMWGKLFNEFYVNDTIIKLFNNDKEIDNCCLRLLRSHLSPAGELVQNRIAKIEHTKNKISFNIYQVVRSSDNQIDFVEHYITSIWKENKVLQHIHIINKH